MRDAKERRRIESPAPDYPAELPDLRMRITVERFDNGHEVQVMELRKTKRVDLYEAYANGKLWREKIGLSKILEGIRKANPRMLSQRAV